MVLPTPGPPAIIIFAGHYAVWEILSLSVMLGIINAFDVPARQSLVYEMIEDKKELREVIKCFVVATKWSSVSVNSKKAVAQAVNSRCSKL